MKKTVLHCTLIGVFLLMGTLVSAQTPEVHGLTLEATSPNFSTNDDLSANYTLSGAVTSVTTWYYDWIPVTVLSLPFEAGASNALLDFSGNNHNMTLPGGTHDPVWSASAGHDGTGAFTFDGDDYLDGGNIFPTNSSYTNTAWIYKTVDGVYQNIISGVLNAPNNHGFKINPDGRLNAGHYEGSYYVIDPDPLLNDQWYFVAVTFDYSTGEMILYKDGVEVDRAIIPEDYRSVTDGGLLVGSKVYSYFFNGNIDDATVYNRALSPEQIQSLYVNDGDIFLSQETRGNERWRVRVTPFSASEVGTSLVTASELIQAPGVSGASLTASSPGSLTIDNLTASFSSNPSVVETATSWFRDGTPDALLYLPFDGGPVDALNDYSGSGNDATKVGNLIADPTWDPTGGHNGSGAYVFDGDDYLSVGDIFPLNSSYTKTAWIYSTTAGFNNIISSTLHGDNNHFFKVNADGRLNAGHSFGTAIVIDPVAMNLNEWYFVAVTFNYSTGLMILYKNGVEVNRATVPEALRSVIDPSVLVGTMDFIFGFDGNIDEPRLYGRELSPQQISAMYTSDDVIVSQETTGGEVWHAEVTPFATCEAGATLATNNLAVHSVVISNINDRTITEGSTFATFDLDDYITIFEFTPADIVWSSFGNTDLTVTINPTTHFVSVTTPNLDWYGAENISFVATNPNADADTTEVLFTVNNVNDAPVLTNIGNQSTNEDTNLTGLAVTFADADPTDSHTITVTSSNLNVTVANLSGNTNGSTYDLVPAADWNGNTQITVTVTDNGSGTLSDFETYTLVVNPVNDAPVLTEIGDQNTDEDTNLTDLDVVFTDVDDLDTHTISVLSDESNVTVANLSGNISGSTYDLVPAANWHGTAQITVTVTDNGTGTLSDVEIYTLTVNSVNDAPVLTEIGAQGAEEEQTLTGLSVVFTDADDLDTHTITVVSGEPNVTVANLSGNTSGSTYNLVPAAEWNGDAQITVTVTDNGTPALSDTEVYTFSVNSVNDAPVLTIVGDQSVDEDNTLQLSVVFSDPDAVDVHSITVVSSDANVSIANLTGHVSGSTYDLVPAANWNGSAQITVTVTDDGEGALFDSETYTFTVNPVNDAPSSISLSNYMIDENVAVGTNVGVFTSVDPDIDDTHLYALISDGGLLSSGNDAFIIDDDTLRTAVELNFEEQETYWILVESDDGNGGTINKYFTINVQDLVETGIQKFGNELTLKVYPVPAIDMVTVEVDNPDNKELLMEIFSDAGQLVHSERTFIGNTIYVNEFPDGLYILRISGENVFETRKIIVKDR